MEEGLSRNYKFCNIYNMYVMNAFPSIHPIILISKTENELFYFSKAKQYNNN